MPLHLTYMKHPRISVFLLSILLARGAIGAGQGEMYASKPAFTAEMLWEEALGLLNERDGAVTKERFELVFGVRFKDVRTDSDATTYLLTAGKDWYFDARLTIYNENFKFQGPFNGAHSEWIVRWNNGFGSDVKQACVKAEHVRDGLLAGGWTSPWKSWGLWEKIDEQTAKNLRAQIANGTMSWMYPPVRIPPKAAFRRATDDETHDRLPSGEIFTDGDFPDSCVTGILVTAAL